MDLIHPLNKKIGERDFMESWERWEPILGIPARLCNDSFLDHHEGVLLEFSDENHERKVRVWFENGVLSYRNTDEGSLLKTWYQLDEQYRDPFYSRWTMFKVKNSAYLTWFIEQSIGIYDPREVEHYVFITPNDVIEVLSEFPPKVQVMACDSKAGE